MHLMLINDKQASLRDIKNFLTRDGVWGHLGHFQGATRDPCIATLDDRDNILTYGQCCSTIIFM